MALSLSEQLKKLVEAAKYVLVVFPPEPNADAVGSALAWKIFLEKLHKQVDVVASGFSAPKNLSFLQGIDSIKPGLTHLQKFIIKVDVSRAKLDTLSYDIQGNWLSIYLTPKNGIISKNELRTAQSAFKYDLLIALSATDMEALGDIFFNNTDLFYRLPIINIDHHASNEQFGQLNLVDLSATSTAEVTFSALQQIDATLIDAPCATALLTGMISETKSFKTPNVTPTALGSAGQLMNLGAERERIVKNLYRTRTLASLKLWGQALTHLQHDNSRGLVWTSLTRDDFSRSGAGEEELRELVNELITTAPEAKIIVVLYETAKKGDGEIKGILSADKSFDALELLSSFNPSGNKKTASFTAQSGSLKEAEEKVLGEIRRKL